MRIVYVHQYFKTPKEPGSTRSYHIIEELIKAGHSITVIGANKEGQKEKVVKTTVDGIDVYFIKNFYSGKLNVKERLWSFFRFMWGATKVLFKQQDVDLVIATSTPLTVGVPALLFKKFRNTPYLFEVRDLWPEFPIQMGALRNPVARGLAKWLEKSIYKNAWHIVALSPGMKDGVVKVLGRSNNVSMIPNMAKVDKFWKREKNEELRKELGLQKNTFKLIHFGAMGIANGLDYIVDAAIALKKRGVSDIEFVFLGDGSVTEGLKEKSRLNDLNNVVFHGRVPMDKTSEIVNLCNASIVPFLDIPILYTNSPNKLFDSLSAGIPIIVNSNGWTRNIVEDYQCGAYVNPNNPEELADILIEWKNNPEKVKQLGLNARMLAETKYDKSILCKKFVKVVNTFDPN